VASGARTARLETNRTLTEAIGLYRASGYREVAAFNDEPYAQHWFEKTLDPTLGGDPDASGPGGLRRVPADGPRFPGLAVVSDTSRSSAS